jgi:regulator of sirC expression with transglutaminase-like and TPR domain
VRRGQFEESLVLLGRLIDREPADPELMTTRGDIYRLRDRNDDADMAIADYRAAIAIGNEPPETHRGLGMIYRKREQRVEARSSLARYLELAPEGTDAAMIRSYLEELGT